MAAHDRADDQNAAGIMPLKEIFLRRAKDPIWVCVEDRFRFSKASQRAANTTWIRNKHVFTGSLVGQWNIAIRIDKSTDFSFRIRQSALLHFRQDCR